MLTNYCFLRDIHKGYLSLEDADNNESKFATELKNFNKGIKTLEKKSFLNNLGLSFSAREKVLNSFKRRLFPIKNEKLLNNINDGLIDLRSDINRKEIPENENLNKVTDIVEKILDFNK